MSDASSNIAIFGLIGALIGAVPGVLSVLFSWLKGRDAVSKSLKKMELLKAEVDFISAWTDAVTSVTEPNELRERKDAARERLDALMKISEGDVQEVTDESRQVKTLSVRKRKSFGFYVYTGFFFFMLFGASINDQNKPSLSNLVDELTSSDGATAVILFGIPWLILLIRWYRSGLNKTRVPDNGDVSESQA